MKIRGPVYSNIISSPTTSTTKSQSWSSPSASCRWLISVVAILSQPLRNLTTGRPGNNTMTSPPPAQYQVPFHPRQPLLSVSGAIILYPATTSPVWMLNDILISMRHLERHLDSPIHIRADMLAQAVRTRGILVVVGVC